MNAPFIFIFCLYSFHFVNNYVHPADIQGDLYCYQVWVLHIMHYYARFMLVFVRTQEDSTFYNPS